MPQAASAACLRLCSLNVQGLSTAKLQALLTWAWEERYDVVMLQECWHGAEAANPMAWFQQQQGCAPIWGGRWFATPGSAHQAGCMILFRPNSLLTDVQEVQLPETAQGRVLRVDAQLLQQPVSLLCVYAPADPTARRAFFAGVLPTCLPDPGSRLLLLGGDWNCVLQQRDVVHHREQGGDLGIRGQGAVQLQASMHAHDLADAWRALHAAASDITHFHTAGTGQGSGARLDRWLLSSSMSSWVQQANILPTRPVHTDHLPVDLLVQPPGSPIMRKPPWRLAPGMVDDADLLQLWRLYLQHEAATHDAAIAAGPLGPSYHRQRWLRVKDQLRHLAQEHQQAHRRDLNRRARRHHRAAECARQYMLRVAADGSAAPATVQAAVTLWVAAASQPVPGAAASAHSLLDAGALLDHLYGGRPTFFFHNHPQQDRQHSAITKLLVSQPGVEQRVLDLSDPEDILPALQAFEQHYSADAPAGVYRQRPTDADIQQQLLRSMSRRLTAQQSAACEGPGGDGFLTLACLQRALRNMQRNKAPGQDGLPVELYMQQDMWPQLGPLMLAAFNEAFAAVTEQAPLQHFLMCILVLVHKPGKPYDQVKGYRPITLLDIDIRLLCLVLAQRLHLPLDLLVAATQSAFIGGRDISDNLLFHLGLADWLRHRHQQCWLLLLDLAGAYDNVDWGLLQATMQAMGFQDIGHVRWAQLLHRGATSLIHVNGFSTHRFPVCSGLLQGSGVSPLYWTIVLQPLSSYLCSLQAQGRVVMPCLPHMPLAAAEIVQRQAPPSQDYADDMTAAATCLHCAAPSFLQAFQQYAAAGGPSLALDGKSTHLHLGHGDPAPHHCVPSVQPFQPAEPLSQRLLGLPLAAFTTPHPQGIAFQRAANTMRVATFQWRQRSVGMLDRVHVVKQCVAATSIYQLSFTAPTARQLADMQAVVREFVASAQGPGRGMQVLSPSEVVCAMPKHLGGLAYPNLRIFSLALQAKPLALLFQPRCRPWQAVMHTLLASACPRLRAGISTWVITAPLALRLPAHLQRLQGYVDALATLHLHRLLPLEQQSFWSVMAEPLYFNQHITIPPSMRQRLQHLSQRVSQHLHDLVPDLQGAEEARAWRSLGDVRAALHAEQPRTLAMTVLLQLIVHILPQPWRAQLLLPEAPPCPWECAALPAGGYVARHQQGQQLYWAASSGLLHPISAQGEGPLGAVVVPPGVQWWPAAVFAERKPDFRMSVLELEEQRRPRPQRPPWPQESWLLGPWAQVQLDPSVWGWAGTGTARPVSLLQYTVKAARHRLSLLSMAVAQPQLYSYGQGVWPRLWGQRPPSQQQGQPAPALDRSGLQQFEQAMHTAFTAIQQHHQQLQQPVLDAEVARPPAWLDLAHPPPPRPPPCQRAARAAARQAASQQQDVALVHLAPPLNQRQVLVRLRTMSHDEDQVDLAQRLSRPLRVSCSAWKALTDATMLRPHVAVAWRILHGALPVGGRRATQDSHAQLHTVCCSARCCQGGHALETLTHAFVECPSVSPVVAWLFQVYQALTRSAPPPAHDVPLVLLADLPGVWQPACARTWHRLRVAFLGCAWQLRCSRLQADLDAPAAAAALAQRVVDTMQQAVMRDWQRIPTPTTSVSSRARELRVPSTWFAGRSPDLSVQQFDQLWPATLPPWFHPQPAGGLQVPLSLTWPVQLQQEQPVAAQQPLPAPQLPQGPPCQGGQV